MTPSGFTHAQLQMQAARKMQAYARRRAAEQTACVGVPTETLESNVIEELVQAVEELLTAVADVSDNSRNDDEIELLNAAARTGRAVIAKWKGD